MTKNLLLTLSSLVLAASSISLIDSETTLQAKPSLLTQNSRPAPNNSVKAMELVSKAVLADAAKRTGKPANELTVSEIKQETWPDACLGLPETGKVCTQANVPGWRLTVSQGQQRLIYRSNLSGTLLKWDAAASSKASQTSVAIAPSEDEDNPAILPNPSPAKLPLRLVEVLPASNNARRRRRQPTAVASPAPEPISGQKPTEKPAVAISPPPETTPNRAVARPPAKLAFNDVPKRHWAREFIAELSRRDIIKGSSGQFRPNETVTNSEFAAMLSLAFPRPNVREAVEFSDITPKEWAHSYLLEAYQRGFLEVRSDNRISPNRKVSRLNVLIALTRGLQYSPSQSSKNVLQVYRDAETIPAEFRASIAAATEKGLVVNYPNLKMLKPNRRATRAEVAALIYQAMASTGQVEKVESPYIVLESKK
jgi:hypothetical protein